MPESTLPLLQPTVLRRVVEQFTTPESLTMLSRIPRTPHPFPTVQWEIIRGSRSIARLNVPNSEANIVPRLGRAQGNASFLYTREKKVFEPTTLLWMRTVANSNTELNRIRANEAILREVKDLNTRADNLAEYFIWQSLTGRIVVDDPNAPQDIDYKFLASHKPKVSAGWDVASPTQIIADIRAMKRLIERDGRVQAREAYASPDTIQYIFDAFANNGDHPGNLLSDRMKDAYFAGEGIPGFMGLDWKAQESVFDANGTAYTTSPSVPRDDKLFLADNALLIGNFTENRPMELYEGATADLDAPDNYVGKFAKTFREPDPSALQHLLEWHFLPVITRPEQFVSVTNVLDAA
jgi:hypothetical protein